MTTTAIDARRVVMAWFEALNAGDPGATRLFVPEPAIRNAANPELRGPEAARRLLEDFYDRTERRTFEVHAVTSGATRTMAWWHADLHFRAGVTVAQREIHTPFTVRVAGVDVFRLDGDGLIAELDIIHETTSVAIAAAKHGR